MRIVQVNEKSPGHDATCHAVERAYLMAYLEIVLTVRLDGDERLIDSILDAMDDVPAAA